MAGQWTVAGSGLVQEDVADDACLLGGVDVLVVAEF